MIARHKMFGIGAVVFIIVVLWGIFFTYGFPFFWEDFSMYHFDKEIYPVSQASVAIFPVVMKTLVAFGKELFSVDRLFQVNFSASYADRPYMHLIWESLTAFFGYHVELFRVVKAVFFALNAWLLFFIVRRVSLVLSVLAVLLFISSPVIWLSLVYSCDMSVWAQLGTLCAFVLFLKLTKKPNRKARELWTYYGLIYLCVQFAALTKCDGRYLACVFGATLLLFRRKEVLAHAPMLGVLLFTGIPVFGFLKKFFFSPAFPPFGTAWHNPMSLSETFQSVIRNIEYPITVVGILLLVAAVLAFIAHMVAMVKLRAKPVTTGQALVSGLLPERAFLFMLWFIASFAMTAVARGFNYNGPKDIQIIDLSFLVCPFIVFLAYYVSLVCGSLSSHWRRFFVVFVTVCIVLQVLLNVVRLNQFRGGWGNYFCAWKNAEKLIDKTVDHALVLAVNQIIYKPFVFRDSHNTVRNSVIPGRQIQAPFTQIDYIQSCFETEPYKDIFVVTWQKQGFHGASSKVSLKRQWAVDGDSGDWYDTIKRALGRASRPEVYVYHFTCNP